MKRRGLFKKERGFSLIELMIVTVILAILASMAIPRYMRSVGKAKKSEAKMVLKQIYELERAYFHENDTYVGAANSAALQGSVLGWTWKTPSGTPLYDYSVVVDAGPPPTFVARATETGDADGDGASNEVVTMDQDGVVGGDWH